MYGLGSYGRGYFGKWTYKDFAAAPAVFSGATANANRVISFAAAITALGNLVPAYVEHLVGLNPQPTAAVSSGWGDVVNWPVSEAYIFAESGADANAYRVRPAMAALVVESAGDATIQHSPTLGTTFVTGVSDIDAVLNRLFSFEAAVHALSATLGNARGRYVVETPAVTAWDPADTDGDLWTPVSVNPSTWQEKNG